MLKDWNFWFSVITAVIAIVALIQTSRQIRLNNKQHLFDRRLDIYLKIDGLVSLYKEHRNTLESKNEDEPLLAADLDFIWLTNNSYLESITGAISEPLVEPQHKEFLIKREELKQLSAEAELVFKGNAASDIRDFIFCYEELLFGLYQYQIIIEKMKEYSNFKPHKATLEQTQEGVGEPEHRKKLLSVYDELKEAYIIIEKNDVIRKLKKQIKL